MPIPLYSPRTTFEYQVIDFQTKHVVSTYPTADEAWAVVDELDTLNGKFRYYTRCVEKGA